MPRRGNTSFWKVSNVAGAIFQAFPAPFLLPPWVLADLCDWIIGFLTHLHHFLYLLSPCLNHLGMWWWYFASKFHWKPNCLDFRLFLLEILSCWNCFIIYHSGLFEMSLFLVWLSVLFWLHSKPTYFEQSKPVIIRADN